MKKSSLIALFFFDFLGIFGDFSLHPVRNLVLIKAGQIHLFLFPHDRRRWFGRFLKEIDNKHQEKLMREGFHWEKVFDERAARSFTGWNSRQLSDNYPTIKRSKRKLNFSIGTNPFDFTSACYLKLPSWPPITNSG